VRLRFAAGVLTALAMSVQVPVVFAAQSPTGMTDRQVAVALGSMPANERAERENYFVDSRYVVVAYAQIWEQSDGSGSVTRLMTGGATQTIIAGSALGLSPNLDVQASSSYVFQGLYISIAVAWDTDVTFEYRYDVQSYFDWQGSTSPWNGVPGDDGLAIYWGNNLALLSDFFWGKYRDGTYLQHASREEAPPNSGVGWKFWEAKNNCCSIADFGWLTATVARSNFTNTITNFTVKYIHSWANLSYTFSWGAGPSVGFSPSTSTQAISTYTSVRT
jgi:hypothetical protein